MSRCLDLEKYIKKLNVTEKEIEQSGFTIVYTTWKEKVSQIEECDYERFINDFFKGYRNRPSKRNSNATKTIPDPIIDKLILARISSFSNNSVDFIRFGHRLSMAAENIIGLILEEYIHNKVLSFGWSCCWGNCFKSVDLCSKEGELIQIKNKSNTENSSSNKIREGTKIKKWFRLKASNGETCWNTLPDLLGISVKEKLLSEDDFQNFASKLIKDNPQCLYVDSKEFESLTIKIKSLS